MIFYYQGKELATSVVSNVKHALGLKINKPLNKTQCTKEYWSKTVQVVGAYYGLADEVIQQAVGYYKDYLSDELG